MKSLLSAIFVVLFASVSAFAAVPDNPYALSGIHGGLVVHIGCGDARDTAALAVNAGYAVHGLDADAAKIKTGRAMLMERGLYGPVSVQHWPHAHLPYTDNMVNLVIAETLGAIPMEEVMRVLTPNGVALIGGGGVWEKTVKPRPGGLGEWTHYLHGPDGNAVGTDTVVASPRYVQWMGKPKNARGHEDLGSISAAVTSGGRIFYIADEGPIASAALPAQWNLVARDAFNGMLLWKRPIISWEGSLRGFRSGPTEMPRRLVAIGDTVYVTLGYGQPVTALDAVTGATIRAYDATENALELICKEGVLYVLTGEFDAALAAEAEERRSAMPYARNRKIFAIDADSGEVLWAKTGESAKTALSSTLCAGQGRVIYQNPCHLICLDLKTGEEQWRTERPLIVNRLEWASPTIVIQDGLVLAAEQEGEKNVDASMPITWEVTIGGTPSHPCLLNAYDLKDGRELWSRPAQETYHAQVDVFVVDGEVWTGPMTKRAEDGITEIIDLYTGKTSRTRASDQDCFDVGMGHHRCYRNKATVNYIILGRSGAEFLDTKSTEIQENHWIRGTCAYGIMPANGLLYVPPHSCACYSQAMLNGFNAFTATRQTPAGRSPELEKGPAHGSIRGATEADPADWPTYRHDAARSGASPAEIPANVSQAWQTPLVPPLSGITAAGQNAYVASIDTHTVHALDLETGKVRWSYTANGRVDSPPTLWGNAVIFGSRDGHVYCLRAEDGELVWRFRAAREDRQIMAYDQLESAWPVSGAVLVRDGQACFAAGRSSFIDDGIWLYRLDAATGKKLSENRIWSYDQETGATPDINGTRWIDGTVPDVLSSDGERIFMRHGVYALDGTPLDEKRAHLYSITGFLDSSWWHRTYWLFAEEEYGGWGGWWQMGNKRPSGRMMAVDDDKIYGFGRDFKPSGNAGQWNTGEEYVLYGCAEMPESIEQAPELDKRGKPMAPSPRKRMYQYDWSSGEAGLEVRAFLKASGNLYAAGPIGNTTHSIVAHRGGEGSVLRVFNAEDGSTVSNVKLDAPPVFDGMAAAQGKLLVALEDGTVRCMAP